MRDRPTCLAPPVAVERSTQPLPAGSCDTHVHVFGAPGKYPLLTGRGYTPHVCLLSQYRQVMQAMGISRAVLVQPSVYGTDNSALIDALVEGGPAFRGVVVPSPATPIGQLHEWHQAGVRGVRLNLVNPAILSIDEAVGIARAVEAMGWHLQVQLDLRDGNAAPLQALLDRTGLPLVVDHMGRLGPDAPRDGLLRMLGTGRCWLKLSAPYRLSRQPSPHADLLGLIRDLIQHRPDRLLWASDWPHTEQTHTMPRADDLAALCHLWLPTPGLRQQVCVDNPRVLYQF